MQELKLAEKREVLKASRVLQAGESSRGSEPDPVLVRHLHNSWH